MIVAEINLVSAKDNSKHVLGMLAIYNDKTAITGDCRNYEIRYFAHTGNAIGRVERWPSESRPVLELVAAAIDALGGKDRSDA